MYMCIGLRVCMFLCRYLYVYVLSVEGMYVYMVKCLYARMFTCSYVCMFVYLFFSGYRFYMWCVYIYIFQCAANMFTYLNVLRICLFVHMCAFMHARICICTCICMCMCRFIFM